MRLSIKAWSFLLACAAACAGPVEFGLADYNAALSSRHLKWKVKYELTIDPPETYHIEPYKVRRRAHHRRRSAWPDVRTSRSRRPDSRDRPAEAGSRRAFPAGVRGARMFAHAAGIESFDWPSYFAMLARDRFNRFTLVFLEAPYAQTRKLASISQLAADYGLDFTLGIWEHAPSADGARTHDELRELLAACPLIRTLQLRSDSPDIAFYRNFVFQALHETGRRVALEPLGSLAEPDALRAAADCGIAIRADAQGWPPGFEMDAPRDFERYALLYWMWGRLGYDPETKPAHGEPAAEFSAAARITSLLAVAQAADPNMYTSPEANPGPAFAPLKVTQSNDWIASIPEAVANRLHRIASAKRTPLETADALLTAANALDRSSIPDFELLARLARYHAYRQRAGYWMELYDQTADRASLDRAGKDLKSALSYFEFLDARIALDRIAAHRKTSEAIPVREIPAAPKPMARPPITHTPVKSAQVDQPINVSLQIGALKDVRSVRLHYRAAESAGASSVIEKPAAATVAFTIPGAVSDVIYYFEILNRENSGWFEPDPCRAKVVLFH